MPASKYSQTEALLDDVVEVLKLGKDIVSTLLETWNLVEQTNLGGGVDLPFRKEKQKKILNRINEVSRRINTFEDDVCNYFAGASNLIPIYFTIGICFRISLCVFSLFLLLLHITNPDIK